MSSPSGETPDAEAIKCSCDALRDDRGEPEHWPSCDWVEWALYRNAWIDEHPEVEFRKVYPRVIGEDSPVVVEEHTFCPRCFTLLWTTAYGEPECLLCGYVNYRYVSPTNGKVSLLSTATTFVVRYVGDVPALADMLTQVKCHRVKNSLRYAVNCPWCHETMQLLVAAGKKKDRSMSRHECSLRHRINFRPIESALGLGWE